MVAGVRYEAEKSNRRTEVVSVRFAMLGGTWVPAPTIPVRSGYRQVPA
jgi:hypothetical protein